MVKTMHFTNSLRASLLVIASLTSVGVVQAQSASDSARYKEAQQMVANGDAAGGRRLADSVANAAPAGSVAFAEGLFWRATLAASAKDSEHEYRQIIVDYPLSGRVPDALLRIGQLESARGENAAALQHFQRLVLEHPESPLHAEASYWVARMYFDTNDASHACVANADALTNVRSSNIELKNKIDFQQQRCRGVTLATNNASVPVQVPVDKAPTKAVTKQSVASKPPVPPTPPKSIKGAKIVSADAAHADSNVDTAAKSAAKSAVASAPVSVPVNTPAATQAPEPSPAPSTGGIVSRPPTKEEVARALASAKQTDIAKVAAAKNAARPDPTDTSADVATAAAAPSPAKSPAPSLAGNYSVQIAAFGTKPPATLLVAKLKGRGYNAYIFGASAPYRVRIGHYATHAAAAEELTKLKAKQIDGFVAEK
jgi:septal ring-binding cell division protein DamX